MKAGVLVLIVLLSMFFAGCQQEKQEAGEKEAHELDEGAIDRHTAEIALDYVGVYRGVLPTASGGGAEVEIELKENGTYSKSVEYPGRDNGLFEYSGDYTWDESGMVIELKDQEGPGLYFVAENHIVHLDENGDRIYSELSDHYVLEKVPDDNQ